MHLNEAKYTITINLQEANDIAYSIHQDLSHSIDTHYNKLQQDVDGKSPFFENNRQRLNIMQFMFEITESSRIYEGYIRMYNKTFADKVIERSKNG